MIIRKLCRSGTLLMAAMLCGTASAAAWRTGDTVTIEKSEVIHDDLYVTGTDVRIDGVVDGDLIVGAQHVTVNGEVRGNLWAAGATVVLNGKVLQTARLAGSVIRVQKGTKVGRDLLAAGSEIEIASGSVVGRDVAFGSSQAQINGKVARNVYGGANGIEVGGVIKGNARLAVSNTQVLTANWTSPGTPGLTFLPGGHIGGDLTLQIPQNPVLPAGTVGGKVTFAPRAAENIQTRPSVFNSAFPKFLRTFIGVALAALLLVWLARPRLLNVTGKFRALPAASLGYGALAFFGLPLAALLGVLALVSVAVVLTLLSLGHLGLPLVFLGVPVLLGVGALVSWLALLAAQGFAAYLLGDWALRTLRPNWKLRSVVQAPLSGAFLLAVLLQIPVVGGLLTFAALLLSLGALWLSLRGPGRELAAPVVGLPQPS